MFVADVASPHLTADDRHHLGRVLRRRDGDPLTVGDGAGRWRDCRFGPHIEPVGPVVEVPRPRPELTVAFALVKGSKPELVVQKLTELGIDRIVPFRAARSVVRWEAPKAGAQADRLARVAREAAMQCRRAWLPEVEVPTDFADVSARSGAAQADGSGGPLAVEHTCLLIGPEGGWTEDEIAVGLDRVALGSHVLRAETAAISAAVLMAERRSHPRS